MVTSKSIKSLWLLKTSQFVGIDYLKTFNLIINITTFRIFLSICATKGWYLYQFDINIEFLHYLHDKSYMKIQPMFSISKESSICKLQDLYIV